MKKLFIFFIITSFLLLCACSPEGHGNETTTEDVVTDSTVSDFGENDEWEGDIDLLDPDFDNNNTETTNGNTGNESGNGNQSGNNQNTGNTSGNGNQSGNGGNSGNSNGNSEQNQGGSSSGDPEDSNGDEPPVEGSIDVFDPSTTTEPDAPATSGPAQDQNGGNNVDTTTVPDEGENVVETTTQPEEGDNSGSENNNSNSGGIELPMIPG